MPISSKLLVYMHILNTLKQECNKLKQKERLNPNLLDGLRI